MSVRGQKTGSQLQHGVLPSQSLLALPGAGLGGAARAGRAACFTLSTDVVPIARGGTLSDAPSSHPGALTHTSKLHRCGGRTVGLAAHARTAHQREDWVLEEGRRG